MFFSVHSVVHMIAANHLLYLAYKLIMQNNAVCVRLNINILCAGLQAFKCKCVFKVVLFQRHTHAHSDNMYA